MIKRIHHPRRLVYSLWGTLPRRLQRLFIYLGAPKLTMGVSAVILDSREQMLLVHHTYRDAAWGFPGGLVGRREQPAVALARELREELGLIAAVGPVLHVDYATRERHLTIYYHAVIEGTPQHDVETDAHRYVSLHEAGELMDTASVAWLLAHPWFHSYRQSR